MEELESNINMTIRELKVAMLLTGSKGILKRLSEVASSYPVIAKETGNGFSHKDALNLIDAWVEST